MSLRHSKLLCGTLVLVSLLACHTALAVTITASDDTWVREDSADSNRNGNDQVNARTDIDADDNDVILLRFPTTTLSTPVSGATLNLTWYRDDSSSDKTLALYGLKESDPNETTWSETTVTYNTAPGMIADGDNPTVESGMGHSWDDIRDMDVANLTLLAGPQLYGPQVTNQLYTFSGAALDAFINADTNGEVTLMIFRGEASTSSNQARFQVKEVGTGAYLEVIPEPSSMVLLSMAALALCVRRKG